MIPPQYKILAVCLIISFVIVFLIFLPYLNSIILSFILWILFSPVFNFLMAKLKNKTLAALLTIGIILIIIIAPFVFISFKIINELAFYIGVLDFEGLSNKLFLKIWAEKFNIDLKNITAQIINHTFRTLKYIFSSTLEIFGLIFVSLFILFYLFKQSNELKDLILKISPFQSEETNKILDKLHISLNSIIYGFLIVALIQGILVGIGFYIFGVPLALIWGVVAIFAALIPMVGTAIITGPAALYLFLNQSVAGAIGLILWGALAVGTIDNILRPYLIQKKSKISAVFVLLSVLGGINYFGPMGFVIGPLILSLFISFLDIFKEFKK